MAGSVIMTQALKPSPRHPTQTMPFGHPPCSATIHSSYPSLQTTHQDTNRNKLMEFLDIADNLAMEGFKAVELVQIIAYFYYLRKF
jgi:hypothetical protein